MSASSLVFARAFRSTAGRMLSRRSNNMVVSCWSRPLLSLASEQASGSAAATTNTPISQYQLSVRSMSAEASAFEEKKEIIPGIGKGKTSTGLVGLAVEHNWYNIMLEKFQLLLDTLEASDMPETAQYRIDVTKWANFVIATVKANPEDPETVEDEVRMGQVEELIVMADDEMIAMKTYIKHRMWEDIDEEGPEIDYNPDPLKDELMDGSDPRVKAKIQEDYELMMNAGLDDEDEDAELDPEYKDFR